MTSTNSPTWLPDYGYSMQAAAIASALIQHDDANTFRFQLREWLDTIEQPFRAQYEDIDLGQRFCNAGRKLRT